MHELQSVVTDIAELEEFEQWRKLRYATHEAGASDRRMIAIARTEMLHVSVLTAVTTGIANALERSVGNRLIISALGVYMPTHTATFLKSIEMVLQSVVDIENGARLQSYLARLDLATRLTRNFEIRAAAESGFEFPDAEAMADAWRRTSGDAVTVIGLLTDSMGGDANPRMSEDAARVLGLLRSATAGNSPGLGPDGHISIPGWAERRRDRRRSVNMPARIVLGKRVLGIKILDASPTGLGVECTDELPVESQIAILFAGNRRLQGRVVWSNGNRTGIELDQRLALLDPLFATQ